MLHGLLCFSLVVLVLDYSFMEWLNLSFTTLAETGLDFEILLQGSVFCTMFGTAMQCKLVYGPTVWPCMKTILLIEFKAFKQQLLKISDISNKSYSIKEFDLIFRIHNFKTVEFCMWTNLSSDWVTYFSNQTFQTKVIL